MKARYQILHFRLYPLMVEQKLKITETPWSATSVAASIFMIILACFAKEFQIYARYKVHNTVRTLNIKLNTGEENAKKAC